MRDDKEEDCLSCKITGSLTAFGISTYLLYERNKIKVDPNYKPVSKATTKTFAERMRDTFFDNPNVRNGLWINARAALRQQRLLGGLSLGKNQKQTPSHRTEIYISIWNCGNSKVDLLVSIS
jgi:hypothetical protein